LCRLSAQRQRKQAENDKWKKRISEHPLGMIQNAIERLR
jgi:hypothetical protein